MVGWGAVGNWLEFCVLAFALQSYRPLVHNGQLELHNHWRAHVQMAIEAGGLLVRSGVSEFGGELQEVFTRLIGESVKLVHDGQLALVTWPDQTLDETPISTVSD